MREQVLDEGAWLRDGRYEVRSLKRATAVKQVYMARDRSLDHAVVIDVVPQDSGAAYESTAWEARILGRLGGHPNIAAVEDYWEADGAAFMVSRYFERGSLRDLIGRSNDRGEPLWIDEILQFSVQLAGALEHVHSSGIVHRDLQPRNVLLDDWGCVRLVDFDTAHIPANGAAPDICDGRDIHHIAPEVVAGEPGDCRADLYSLGTTIYEMVSGRPPHTGTNEVVIEARRLDPTPSIHREDLPAALTVLIARLMSPAPEDRPASAAEVLGELADIRRTRAGLSRLLRAEESTVLEFKSTLRTPVGPADPVQKMGRKELEKALEHSVLKSIAALLNTNGGTLVIGVADDRSIVGIETDFPRTQDSKDGWRLTFDTLVSSHLGADAMAYIDLELAPWSEKTVAIVRCSQRDQPTWLHDELFIRETARTENLKARPACTWYVERWRTGLLHGVPSSEA
jgi:serine/threonine protein kinase